MRERSNNNKQEKERGMKMNKGDKITIQFDGKDVEVTVYAPGVVQKTASIFYIKDSVSGEYLYCFPARLDKLLAKNNGDLSGFKGRETKALARKAVKSAKAAERAAKKEAKAVVATPAPVAEEPAPAFVDAPVSGELVEA